MSEAASPTAKLSFRFASKATTLERLAPRIMQARTCDQVTLQTEAWRRDREALVAEILGRFGSIRLSVRSSAAGEDGWEASRTKKRCTSGGSDGPPARAGWAARLGSGPGRRRELPGLP